MNIMANNNNDLTINICTNSETNSSPPKKKIAVSTKKNKEVLKVGKRYALKGNVSKVFSTESVVNEEETKKKRVMVTRKGFKGFKVTEEDKVDKSDSGVEGKGRKADISSRMSTRQSFSSFTLNLQDKKKTVNQAVKAPLFTSSHFSNLSLHPHMIANLRQNLGIDKLTTVQELAIPVITSGRDALIRSQTGSGKTFAYAVPIVEALHAIRPKVQRSDGVLAVIIVPTRELALQTYEWFLKLVKPYTWVVPGYLAGGEKRKSEKARLRRGVNILVSTPGRLVDHVCHTKNLQLDIVKYLVLDEADRMLDLGYEKDISSIVSSLDKCQHGAGLQKWEQDGYIKSNESNNFEFVNVDQRPRRQTILLSATLTKEVYKLAGLTLREPSKIDASGGDVEEDSFVVPQNIVQWYVMVPPKFRLVVLAAFIAWKCKMTQGKKMLVFCATQDMVDYLTELLTQVLGTSESAKNDEEDEEEKSGEGLVDVEFFKLHGNMSQKDRIDVFKSFRDIEAGVLLCTDVASRGLDLPRVDWVIQWTAPPTPTDYVHRVGRTARGGSTGSAILFLAPTEAPFLLELGKKSIGLQEETVDRCLQNLLAVGISTGNFERYETRTVESVATAMQLHFEDAVLGRHSLHQLGCKAFTSFVRFYATYPKESRDAFSVRRLHLGHYAKGFALRDPPSAIGVTAGKGRRDQESSRGQRSNVVAPRNRPASKRKGGLCESRSQMLLTSEYASGLDAKRRKKRKTEDAE